MAKDRIEVALDGTGLMPETAYEIFERPITVRLAPAVLDRVRAGRARLERLLRDDVPYYGINTGFGSLCDQRIAPDQLDTLQRNLILSHAMGVGEPVPEAVVRFIVLFKLLGLSSGLSGVREEVIQSLAALLNTDLVPIIPSKGSLGASGDLAPLAHLSLSLMGLGNVIRKGSRVSADVALKEAGLAPLVLKAKEGLALINGTQFMTGYGAAICARAHRASRFADLTAAMSLEALRGNLSPFDPRLHEARPHPGAVRVARTLRLLLADRPAQPSVPYGRRVQDPYSLRCVPQVHGAVRDVLSHAEEVIFRDVNSVTDNPILTEDGTVLSGGGFHGEPLALVLDYLACALSELAGISERRQYLLLHNREPHLPPTLTKESGLNSGFLIAQYTSASLVGENKVLCHPASVDSIPTADGQEDHVSMGATAAVKAWQIMDNLETVLSFELMLAAQALEYTPITDRAPIIQRAQAAVRERIAPLDRDRLIDSDLQAALTLLRSDWAAGLGLTSAVPTSKPRSIQRT